MYPQYDHLLNFPLTINKIGMRVLNIEICVTFYLCLPAYIPAYTYISIQKCPNEKNILHEGISACMQ